VTIDRPAALVTALHRPESGDLAIHAANFGAARSATISGIPEGVATLSVVVTTETEKFVSRAPVSVAGGSVTVDLPAHSLVTLTTVAEKSEY
jgi:O-glycosyl hydrolase